MIDKKKEGHCITSQPYPWPWNGDLRPGNYMKDLAAGRYRLIWEADVQVTDGTSFGFPAPERYYGQKEKEVAE